MNMQHDKNATMRAAFITAAIGILLGVLLILIPVSALLYAVFVVMGIVTVVGNLPTLIHGIWNFSTPAGKANLLLSSISVILGLLMIFWNNGILMIILGIYMLLFPIADILMAQDKLAECKSELPKLILGLILILLGPAGTFDLLFDIAGGIVIALSVLYVVWVYAIMRRRQNTPGSRIFVDTDGNGTIDAVYVDTTGDGKADTATHYQEKQ